MGYMLGFGHCYTCGAIMSFNPNRVPSIRDPRTGEREPICRGCIEKANPIRVANGLPPIEILPDAYESCPEDEA